MDIKDKKLYKNSIIAGVITGVAIAILLIISSKATLTGNAVRNFNSFYTDNDAFLGNPQASVVMVLFYVLMISIFISIIFFDYLYLLIPDKIVLPLSVLVILFNYLFRQPEFITLLLSALTMGGIFAIMHIASGGKWVGLGDAKLLFLIGLVLSYPLGFVSMILSVWTAALTGIGLIIFGKASRKTALPFGSFLAGVSILIIIFQNEVQKIIQKFI